MKKILLGCSVIRAELEEALSNYKMDDIEVIWMESGLHAVPEKLRTALQAQIDELTDCELIILGYGLCGNALLGIEATNCDILYPKTDDCISALMCENCRLKELRRDSFFTSRGWLQMRTDEASTEAYERMVEKYGQEMADELNRMMFGNYKHLVYMQTEEHIDEEDLAHAQERADKMGIELLFEPASSILYDKLLLCDETYPLVKRLKKGEVLALRDFFGN